jgi:hypothetical protein
MREGQGGGGKALTVAYGLWAMDLAGAKRNETIDAMLDGSWHVVSRSKPVQAFFDNEDPHGKDQSIFIMATNWAVASLANFQASGDDPIESFQVVTWRNEQRRLDMGQVVNPFIE